MIDFNKIADKLFRILKGHGYQLALYNNEGARVFDPLQARRFFAKPVKIMLTIFEDGDRSEIKVYLSKEAANDLDKIQPLISSLRETGIHSNLTLTVRKYGRDLSPKDFAFLAGIKKEVKESVLDPLRVIARKWRKDIDLTGDSKAFPTKYSKEYNFDKIGAIFESMYSISPEKYEKVQGLAMKKLNKGFGIIKGDRVTTNFGIGTVNNDVPSQAGHLYKVEIKLDDPKKYPSGKEYALFDLGNVRKAPPNMEGQRMENTINESMYGSTRSSYQKVGNARVIVRHSDYVNEKLVGGRGRNIHAIFVETFEGERFKYPVMHLNGARAMAQHIANKGTFQDHIGEQIIHLSEQYLGLKQISSYIWKNRGKLEESAFDLRGRIKNKINEIQNTTTRIIGQRGYTKFVAENSKEIVKETGIDEPITLAKIGSEAYFDELLPHSSFDKVNDISQKLDELRTLLKIQNEEISENSLKIVALMEFNTLIPEVETPTPPKEPEETPDQKLKRMTNLVARAYGNRESDSASNRDLRDLINQLFNDKIKLVPPNRIPPEDKPIDRSRFRNEQSWNRAQKLHQLERYADNEMLSVTAGKLCDAYMNQIMAKPKGRATVVVSDAEKRLVATALLILKSQADAPNELKETEINVPTFSEGDDLPYDPDYEGSGADFYHFQHGENYVSPSEKAWDQWIEKAKKLAGHSLDGNEDTDGYSLDGAYAAFEAGITPEAYIQEIKGEFKEMREINEWFKNFNPFNLLKETETPKEEPKKKELSPEEKRDILEISKIFGEFDIEMDYIGRYKNFLQFHIDQQDWFEESEKHNGLENTLNQKLVKVGFQLYPDFKPSKNPGKFFIEIKKISLEEIHFITEFFKKKGINLKFIKEEYNNLHFVTGTNFTNRFMEGDLNFSYDVKSQKTKKGNTVLEFKKKIKNEELKIHEEIGEKYDQLLAHYGFEPISDKKHASKTWPSKLYQKNHYYVEIFEKNLGWVYQYVEPKTQELTIITQGKDLNDLRQHLTNYSSPKTEELKIYEDSENIPNDELNYRDLYTLHLSAKCSPKQAVQAKKTGQGLVGNLSGMNYAYDPKTQLLNIHFFNLSHSMAKAIARLFSKNIRSSRSDIDLQENKKNAPIKKEGPFIIKFANQEVLKQAVLEIASIVEDFEERTMAHELVFKNEDDFNSAMMKLEMTGVQTLNESLATIPTKPRGRPKLKDEITRDIDPSIEGKILKYIKTLPECMTKQILANIAQLSRQMDIRTAILQATVSNLPYRNSIKHNIEMALYGKLNEFIDPEIDNYRKGGGSKFKIKDKVLARGMPGKILQISKVPGGQDLDYFIELTQGGELWFHQNEVKADNQITEEVCKPNDPLCIRGPGADSWVDEIKTKKKKGSNYPSNVYPDNSTDGIENGFQPPYRPKAWGDIGEELKKIRTNNGGLSGINNPMYSAKTSR